MGGGNSFSGPTGGGTRRSTTRVAAKHHCFRRPPQQQQQASGETLSRRTIARTWCEAQGNILRENVFVVSAKRKSLDSEFRAKQRGIRSAPRLTREAFLLPPVE